MSPLPARETIASAAVVNEPVHGGHIPAEAFGLSGIELLRSLVSQRIPWPPIAHLTGMRFTEVGPCAATFTMPITDWLRVPQGIVTGGEVAILADGPLGCAVHSALPPATGYTTTELSISMVRPVPPAGHLVARGNLVHGGRQLALSEVFVTDDAGRLIAHGTSRCFVFPLAGTPEAPANLPQPHHDDPAGWLAPWQRSAPGSVLPDEVWASQSGLEVMRGLIDGRLPAPPVAYLLGMFPVEASEGRAVFSVHASDWLTSPLGLVEGGITACVAELALASAVQTTIPAGTAYAPTDLRVQFIRPVPPDGRALTATGTVVHRGRTVATARADVVNSDQKLVATATGSAVILPGRRADLRDLPQLG
jgi:uncharacterized protein (TIGR00369 family)